MEPVTFSFLMPDIMSTNNIDLLTVNETAGVLRVSPRSVRRLLTSGDLPFCRVRSSIRISRDDIVLYLNSVSESATKSSVE